MVKRYMRMLWLSNCVVVAILMLSSCTSYNRNTNTPTSFTVANQTFFDALELDTIEIFVMPPARIARIRRGRLSILIRPVRYVPDQEERILGFVGHNHGCVLTYACYLWEEDRELACALIGLMSVFDPGAFSLVKLIKKGGTDSTETLDFVGRIASQYEWRKKAYGPKDAPLNSVLQDGKLVEVKADHIQNENDLNGGNKEIEIDNQGHCLPLQGGEGHGHNDETDDS